MPRLGRSARPRAVDFQRHHNRLEDYRGRRPNLRSGTSFAAPIISGIAARLLADRPDLTPQQIESWIHATPSRVMNPDATMADGRVAYVRSIAPAAATSASVRAALEP